MSQAAGEFFGLNLFIFVTSAAAFCSPLFCKLHEAHLQAANALSCGLLVGVCLFIILPEGLSGGSEGHGGEGGGHHDADGGHGPSVALLMGFISQLLIDVAISRKGEGHWHHGHHHHHQDVGSQGHSRSATHMLTSGRILVPPDEADGLALASITKDDSRRDEEAGHQARGLLVPTPPNSPPKARVSQSGSAGLTLPKMDATAGLVFGLLLHCIADGVALGSSSLSHSEALRASVFVAMALHKIPVAFATGSLVHQQQYKQPLAAQLPPRTRLATFVRWALTFSLSSPVSALITYLVLGGLGSSSSDHQSAAGQEEDEEEQPWVKEGMLFSAGTFLFVTVGHILPELLHSQYMRGPQGLRLLVLLLVGLLSMFVLASFVGEH